MQEPKTIEEVLAIIADVHFPDYEFYIGEQRGGEMYLQIRYDEPCVDTGELKRQHGRKWTISKWMTKSEIVQTAFKAIMTSFEHRAREHFLYRGKNVFGPHFDVDKLWELCHTGCALDVREDPQAVKEAMDETRQQPSEPH